ncbi:sulfate ABC transporter ATP-binding protein [Nordella sp. HKS 07]|uniref:sulfate/molybdate ABC transporter ATP-binding protein n=1 Tax=Nordella sp. HKS 07 TaxID=2712222 RepID=UPI0013E1F017|nr:sulfate ABC transporter ATP-binding protein [Nordella sp. HKS 07]QIG48579.1 sulfate ABC transporter ATP-binding protein [Nordella sp. HKS 07]
MSIDAIDISKGFDSFVALKSVSLSVNRGELLALLGPSGSGKTTLLRIIAGLEWPDAGDVRIEGKSVLRVDARERGVGFVFQHYALFRHMTVFDNVAFGLTVRARNVRPSTAEIAKRVQELLDLVQIGRLINRYPSELSGGQRQRVALARALAIEPIVLLLDEPFGALDAKVRKELRRWLRRLNEETGMTSIFVTHDQEEAMEIADRVVVMSQGRIEQIGKPREIYENPANPFVCEFLGSANRIPLTWADGRMTHPAIDLDAITVRPSSVGAENIYVRPHDIDIVKDAAGVGTVRFLSVVGPMARVDVEINTIDKPVEIEMPAHRLTRAGIEIGAPVRLSALKGHMY